MSNLKQRIEKLEKAQGGGASDFDSRLRKYCEHAHYDYDFIRNAVNGHESEIQISEDGYLTYENFLTIYRCVCP
jgi:hypothetical protein